QGAMGPDADGVLPQPRPRADAAEDPRLRRPEPAAAVLPAAGGAAVGRAAVRIRQAVRTHPAGAAGQPIQDRGGPGRWRPGGDRGRRGAVVGDAVLAAAVGGAFGADRAVRLPRWAG